MSKWRVRFATITELILDGAMLLCFIAQAFLIGCLLTYGHLPLPSKWSSQIITEHLPEGMSITAEGYALALDGTLRLENLEVSLDGLEQPVFGAEYAHFEFNVKWDKSAPINLRECTLSRGVLTLPAVYSPSGNDSPILEHISLRLIPADAGFSVDSFAALHEAIRLRGSVQWTQKKQSREPLNIRAQADVIFKHIAGALREKQLINGLETPTIFFHLNATDEDATELAGRISSPSFSLPKIRGKNLALNARLHLSEQAVRHSNILLEADSIELPAYHIRASDFSAKVQRDDWEALLQGQWPEMEVAAEKLTVDQIDLDAPQIRLRPQNFPDIDFDGTTSGLKGAVQFSGSINASSRAATIKAEGSLDLLSIAPEALAAKLPKIDLKQPPHYIVEASFKEGFLLNEAALRARVDRLGVEDLNFDHIRLRGTYHNGVYSINRLYMRRDWQWLKLGLTYNQSVRDYSLILEGSAKPDDYNALLPRWWAGLFRDFDFAGAEDSLGNFVIYGNTGKNSADFFFGHAKAKNVSYSGVLIDQGDLFVRGRGPYAEIFKLDAKKGEGFARGRIRFASRIDEVKGPVSVRLDLDTKLPLSDAQKLFDEDIAKVLSKFETDALPRTRLKGVIFNKAYPDYEGLSHISVSANCPDPLNYNGIPMDYLDFDLFGTEGGTYLRNLRFGYAGGEGLAEVDILTEGDRTAEARFRASLKNADQYLAINQLKALSHDSSTNEIDENRMDKGRLSLGIQARGPVDNLLQMTGSGSLQIENEELYAIQLFGPLSKLLQNTALGFTSFALNEMQADFTISDGTVNFSELDINGPKTRIEAPGTVRLEDYALNMRVSVYLFGNAGNPKSKFRRISNIITRQIPNLLEFDLTGTAENQKWQSHYDPRKFIPIF